MFMSDFCKFGGKGKEFTPEYVVPTVRHGRGSIMV